jgi:hypothetical protein
VPQFPTGFCRSRKSTLLVKQINIANRTFDRCIIALAPNPVHKLDFRGMFASLSRILLILLSVIGTLPSCISYMISILSSKKN